MGLLNQRFDARAFHPEWGNEGVDGVILLSHVGLRLEYDGGALDIPLGRLVATVRVGDEERLVFSDAGLPGLEIFTTAIELLDCPIQPLQEARRALITRLSRRDVRRRFRILAWSAAVVVVVTILGNLILGFMVRSIVARIPPEREAAFGAEVLAEMREEWTFVQNTNALAWVSELAAPLLRVLPPVTNGYQFHFIREDDPNAFALPGGHIVITSGMLAFADAEELLGVLAHEVAHVTERHIYRQQISTAGPLLLFSLFVGRHGGFGTLMGGGAAVLVGAGFSQEYETEADEVGWGYLLKANVNPHGMIRLFGQVKDQEERQGLDVVPQAFRSHPATEQRIRHLEGLWKKLSRRAGFHELPAPPKFDFGPAEKRPETDPGR